MLVSLSLILNETLLIRGSHSAWPPGSHGRSRHTDHSIRLDTLSYNVSFCSPTFVEEHALVLRKGKFTYAVFQIQRLFFMAN